MKPFRWRRGLLVATLDPHEAVLLRQVVSEVRTILGETHGETGSGGAGAEPVLERLLPDGNRTEPALARDYRSLTEAGLREEKLADAAVLLDSLSEDGGRVELDENDAEAWLRTINDVRLAIGVSLDISEADDPLDRAEQTGDPRWAAYSWLTAVQGLLVDALSTSN